MLFSEIRGLEYVKKTLLRAAQNKHLAHAQLFQGKEGSANLALALALATYVNCENPSETDACGSCSSCAKNQKFIHPDLHFAFPVSGTTAIKGDDVHSRSFLKPWRKFISSQPFGSVSDWATAFGAENKNLSIPRREAGEIISSLSLKSFQGKYKVMLIWIPECMNVQCANGILKILEEPPDNTLFLLVTNDSDRLLITILSRTQINYIPSYQDSDIEYILQNQYKATPEKAQELAQIVEGNLSKAIRLLHQSEGTSYETFRQWMNLCYTWNFMGITTIAENFAKQPRIDQQNMFSYGISLLRESLICAIPAKELNRSKGVVLEFANKFAKLVNHDQIEEITNYISNYMYYLDRNANAKILFMDLSIKIAKILRKEIKQ